MSDATAPQAFRWRLEGDEPPPLTAAIRVGNATRAAIYRAAEARGFWPLPDSFHHGSDARHTHAFWLVEDADDDARIDHVLLFAASGLPRQLLPALAETWSITLADLGQWRLAPSWMGQRVPGPLFGPSRSWNSMTAYVRPIEVKRKQGTDAVENLDATNQLRWEIGMRHLGSRVIDISISATINRGTTVIPARNFVLRGRARPSSGKLTPENWLAPKDAEPVGVHLQFGEPVWGPLALGFGAHFGLGLFEPTSAQS